eukprot:TRINITY_DN11003_c0_g1_i3.p1 TRINITY_DN11003_c0_g1~~TRINITY_DN11003_c0_g1_i3.p1  ORF type:complete len:106 (+),score=12.13 TRINITY_DN11003_c0_g1_i3:334-651(+)
MTVSQIEARAPCTDGACTHILHHTEILDRFVDFKNVNSGDFLVSLEKIQTWMMMKLSRQFDAEKHACWVTHPRPSIIIGRENELGCNKEEQKDRKLLFGNLDQAN